ncbi:MAG: hypothetical protein WCI18_04135 [Pseudomonadota bacterium]
MKHLSVCLVSFGILAGTACTDSFLNFRTNKASKSPASLLGAKLNTDYKFDPYVRGDHMIGISHIGHEPEFDKQTLDDGVAAILRINVRSAFFYLTPEYQSKYSKQDFGSIKPKTLTELADLPPYRRAFSMFENVVLTCTTDSFSSIGLNIRDHYLTDDEYAANRKEFFDLTTYLMKTYSGTKKRFILKNWEGDWLLMAGYEDNLEVPDSRVTNFVRWFRSTQEGIAQARDMVASDVKVDFALEMNRIGIVQANKRNTFLGSVVPQVPSDWISYSAWETISNRGGSKDPDSIYKSIVSDLNDIKARAGRPLFISEFAYPESDTPGFQRSQVHAAVRAFEDVGIPLAFYWNTYERPYGLFKTDGSMAPNESFGALRREVIESQVNDAKYFAGQQAVNVTKAFFDVFNRKPNSGDLDYWLNSPASLDPRLIQKYLAQSDEAVRVVSALYRKYKNWDADEGTKQYFLKMLENGSTIYDIEGNLYRDYAIANGNGMGLPPPQAPSNSSKEAPNTQTKVTPKICIGSILSAGQRIEVAQLLCSTDGRFQLAMQEDGNLVIYQAGSAIWASNTGGSGATFAILQYDGNLLLYKDSSVVWASHTGGRKANSLIMQNDGNLVIYNGSDPVWASNTGGR